MTSLLLASGCATSSPSRLFPSAAEWRQAAGSAIRDPDTWVPAAAAIAVAASGQDQEISDWASRETPIFGSTAKADSMSDELKASVHLTMLATALVPNRNDDSLPRRLLVGAQNEATTIPNELLTDFLKREIGRERPDESNRAAFPSGHASTSATYAAIAERNLESSKLTPRTRRMTMIAARVLVGGTAWARVEAKKHYPTDVLAGIALGNALTVFVDRAFRAERKEPPRIAIEPTRDGVAVMFRMSLWPVIECHRPCR
ncbi:MAG TPA: phosphatase PAP2 family protein [Thermoanaerobaculia bacterium]